MILHRKVDYRISINPDFKIPALNSKYRIQRLSADTVISKEDLDFFKDKGCEVREIQLFSGIAATVFPIHIDGFDTSRAMGALNLVISDSQDWSMEWFEQTKNNTPDKFTSSGNTNYMTLAEEHCVKIDECQYQDLFLVRVDIPHRVINSSQQERHCLSIRFKNNDFETLNNLLP